ncbi:MAG TPA: DUF1178 family protein [Roseiarcus sp.]|nr:DUF1178 family protein [Roseiarcus sp.]
MIKYALRCAEGHDFESWFSDSAAYETQRKRGFVLCPECGSAKIDKAIMAPAIVGADRPPPETTPEPPIDDKRRRLREMMTQLRREIEKNTDDVGRRFPEVARAIHYGEAPERAVRGRASASEAEALIEEGVGIMPIPMLADELN